MDRWWPIFAPIVALAVNVVVQIVAFRLRRGRQFFQSVVLGFAVGLLALLVLQAIFPPGATAIDAWSNALLVNVPIYGALSYCFFNFANLGQSSIRVRIYARIANQTGGVSAAELAADYNEASLMNMRLQRLVESGDIVLRDGRYFLGRQRFVPIAHTIFSIKRFVLGKTSEFPA
jgi:hypothetical protein